jgi:hypothetical protein
VTRPKSERISQKNSRQSAFLAKRYRRPPFFDAKHPLTGKNIPYTPHRQKQVFININSIKPFQDES